MKTATITALCVIMSLAMVLADYGGSYGYGGYSYVPVQPKAGGDIKDSLGDGGLLILIGLLILLTQFFATTNFFNRSSSASPVTLFG